MPDEPEGLTLGTGTYNIIVVVEDEWGATTRVTLNEKVTVKGTNPHTLVEPITSISV